MRNVRDLIIQKLDLQQVHFSGKEIRALCPFHSEKHPSFSINIETGFYFCQSCKAKGKIKLYACKDQVTLPVIGSKQVDTTICQIDLPKEYIPCYEKSRYKIPRYLRDRLISLKVLRQFKLGFCNTGYYKNRAIIPVFDSGKLAGFISRSMLTQKFKYLYPRRFKKSFFVFNLDYCLKEKYDEIFLTEGVFDVFNLYQQGFENTVAIFGKIMSEHQLLKLQQAKIKRINLLLDLDVNVKELYSLYVKLSLFFDVYIMSCFPCKDPGEMSVKQIEQSFLNKSKLIKVDVLKRSLTKEKVSA